MRIPVIIESRRRQTGGADGESYEIVIAANNEVSPWHRPVDLASLDLDEYMKSPVVLWHHKETAPVGKTLNLRREGSQRIIAEFVFAKDDELAREVKNLWDQGVVNAASITVEEWPRGRHYLQEWSLVTVPADRDAIRRSAAVLGPAYRSAISIMEEGTGVTVEEALAQINQKVEAALQPLQQQIATLQRSAGGGAPAAAQAIDLSALGTTIVQGIGGALRTVFQERDAAQRTADEQRANADAQRAAADQNAQAAAQAQQEQAVAVSKRAALLQRAAPMLPQGFNAATVTSDKDIYVAALGAQFPNAAQESEDYLRALFDGVVASRSAALQNAPQVTPFHQPAAGMHVAPGVSPMGAAPMGGYAPPMAGYPSPMAGATLHGQQMAGAGAAMPLAMTGAGPVFDKRSRDGYIADMVQNQGMTPEAAAGHYAYVNSLQNAHRSGTVVDANQRTPAHFQPGVMTPDGQVVVQPTMPNAVGGV